MASAVDIAVVDYGMGNLRSVSKALEHIAPHLHIEVSSDPSVIALAHRVVFPGVGAMGDCMHELAQRGLNEVVRHAAQTKPFLGICLGMQMLFEHSEEGDVAGLGILSGKVRRFADSLTLAPHGGRLKVPHMGWNQVHPVLEHPLWQGIDDGARFYFVHSYYVEPTHAEQLSATTHYPFAFASAVVAGNVFAVQFHPEKSQHAGLRLLENFVVWDGV